MRTHPSLLATSGLALALGFLLPGCVSVPDAPPPPLRPNVILIVVDDLGYGDLGCYGQRRIHTPNLDKLASEGMRFTQFYAGSCVGAPSRCVLLTGQHTGHAHVRANRSREYEQAESPLPAGALTLARMLAGSGYYTCCLGRWSLGGPDSSGTPAAQGFTEFFGYLDSRDACDHYPAHLWRNGVRVEMSNNTGGVRAQYAQDMFAAEALGFLRRQSADKPFFLYLPLIVPHPSLEIPEDSLRQYAGLWKETPYHGAPYRDQATPRAAYAAMISRMDGHLYQIMRLLRESGLDENTLVLFTSDNGPGAAGGADPLFFRSTGPLRGGKGSLYEGGIRVPLIARWPAQVRAGSVSHTVCAAWDLLPTLAEASGAVVEQRIDGHSLLDTLRGRPLDDARARRLQHGYLYWEHDRRQQAVRLGPFKAVRQAPGSAIELYDLEEDIGETRDVAADHPEIVKQVELILRAARTPSALFPLAK